jgi:hypothetical protein
MPKASKINVLFCFSYSCFSEQHENPCSKNNPELGIIETLYDINPRPHTDM